MIQPQTDSPLRDDTCFAGGGDCLHAIGRDADGSWFAGNRYPYAPYASFGVHAARYDLHYLVDERARGRIGVHRHDGEGWRQVALVPSGGDAPCHLALNPDGTLLAVANYANGALALIALDPADGIPSGEMQVHIHNGSGPNRERQDGPHAHWVGFSPDGRWLYQTDLGTDRIYAFAIDAQGALGPPRTAYAAPPGSGPRHLLLHPRLATRTYLASELASTLTTLHRDGDRFGDHLSTLPDGWQGENIVAHIAMNRACDRLYVSNRGHDSIAVFAVDRDGVPILVQHVASGGAFPRFFLLIEDQGLMIVANEQAQTLTFLAIDADGRLSPTDASLAIPGVAYVFAGSAGDGV